MPVCSEFSPNSAYREEPQAPLLGLPGQKEASMGLSKPQPVSMSTGALIGFLCLHNLSGGP